MAENLEEIKQVFPSAREILVAGKKIVVKPMVWKDFLSVIEDFGKVLSEVGDLTQFDEKKDLPKLIPVLTEILNIFSKWMSVELNWLKENLTAKETLQLVNNFLEVNEWDEIKTLFLGLKLKVQKTPKN